MPNQSLTLFDLDNTLLGGDSDYLWGQFLVEQGIVDPETYAAANRRFYQQYRHGSLDIAEFLAFSLKPLSEHPPERLYAWRERFVAEKIEPLVLPAAQILVNSHRERGDRLAIITATNAFVTEPIAELFGIQHLIATQPEFRQGRYTGRFTGTPCFQAGKVTRLMAWLREQGLGMEQSTFYSDSHNDLPLLEKVRQPVAVDPDSSLEQTARHRNWPILTLRQTTEPVRLDGPSS
ncbi:MAG: HAD family hydrolase [Methylothermaceae bacterium]|nr:HAD family hydrolase [Methylothermaceae bacterium]